MKKKFFFIILAVLFIFSFLYKPLSVNATGIEALPYIISTGWDSTVAAYGALKGFQYGSSSATPEIVGDYTKPYTYSNESIAPLKPSWDSFANDFFVNNWSDLYPVYSEADAQKAWELEKKSFDEKIGLGSIDMNSYLYNVLNNWLPSLVGTDYILASSDIDNPALGTSSYTISCQFPNQVENGLFRHYYPNIVSQSVLLPNGVEPSDVTGVIIRNLYYPTTNATVGYINTNEYSYRITGSCSYTETWVRDNHNNLIGFDYTNITPNYSISFNGGPITGLIDSGSSSWSWYDDSYAVGNIPVPDNYEQKDIVVGENSSEVITQLPVGNPNDNNDKDNKKITVLPNVPSISGNLNNLGNINNGQLPIKFPSPDQNGLIPSIPVLGNGGITVNIPVTNNNYEVINNYDEHQEIYNNNYSYPTINQNYVNYYINQGAITYEQFLQALQKYFNVITYNNETNNYYPTTINNTTNNYYTIQEVIGNEIPPILPPSTISVIDRFPFSIPFDIYKLLCLFNTPPHYWEWDVPVPTFQSGGSSNENYHGEIGHIDFSSTMHISLEQWEPVALVLRTMFSVLWLLFLYFLFQKLVH